MSREPALRWTWAWLWTALALAFLAVGGGIVAAIALSGESRGAVALAIILVGFPALLGALALGTLALIMARPAGSRWRLVRRWVLAFIGAVALLAGLASLVQDATRGAVALIVAGVTALVFLALDVRRGRGEE